MSRILNVPIAIPENVSVRLNQEYVNVEGNKGSLFCKIPSFIKVKFENEKLKLVIVKEQKKSLAIAGTIKTLIKNMILGVSKGFEKSLKLVGIGYKVTLKKNIIVLTLGFSHEIKYRIPENITVEYINQNEITVKGINKQIVGQVASDLRSYRKPEPYKGKGIRYLNEIVNIKESKKK